MSSVLVAISSYHMTAAWAVDREFFDIYLVPLVALGCLWGVFGPPWDALESLWLSFGAPLAFPWVLCTALGKILDFVGNWTSNSEQMGRITAACRQNRASRNSRDTEYFGYLCLRLPTFATFPTQQVLLRAPFLHAPGARMTVVELTPSNDCKYVMFLFKALLRSHCFALTCMLDI